jgi:surface protein
MKAKLLLFAVFFCVTAISYSQNEFITTWKTDNPGTSNATSITIPNPLGGTNSYDVDWTNDGTFDDLAVNGSITHDYGAPGTYTVAIRGSYIQINFNDSGDKQKILSIEQWGDIVWDNMQNAFYGCTNLINNATDAPDLSISTFFTYAFALTPNFNGDLSNWDVSNATYMYGMFAGSGFNGDVSNWDVSNVTDMQNMFLSSNFNGDISSWDVSSVTNMRQMFSSNTVFNGDISNWDVSNVTILTNMFNGASAFNGDLSNWNVSSVTDMSGMFANAQTFNSDISNWNVSNVTDMTALFARAQSFNGDISNWDVSNVTTMQNLFWTGIFNGDISNWDVSSVTNMSHMFYQETGASVFNGDISNWDVSSVTNMSGMFRNASVFNSDISSWNVSNVTDMDRMFNNASVFNQDLSSWDVSSVTDMSGIFFNASVFNSNISNWNVSNVTDMDQMFLIATSFNQDLGSWDVSNVTTMASMFSGVTLSTANYDALLNGWNALTLQNGVDFNAGSSKYCNGEVARNNMISTFGWTIADLGLDCTGLSTDSFNVNALKIYPNPSTGMVYLKNTTGDFVQVYNVLGQEVYKAAINSNQETQELNLNHLQSGLYIAKISDALHSTTERIIIE